MCLYCVKCCDAGQWVRRAPSGGQRGGLIPHRVLLVFPDQSAQSQGKISSQYHCHPPHPHTCGGGSLWRMS